MRRILIFLAATAFIAMPASAQRQRPSEKIQEYAPAIDRTADALLNLDLGPILDAADPYRRHHHRTVRDMARRDDPDFERRMHATIYGSAATMGRYADAFAAAQPAMRRALTQFEHDMAASMAGVSPPPGAGPGYAPPAPPRGAGPGDAAPQPAPDDDDDPWGD